MDDLGFLTVGKLYIEVTRLQRIAEAQQSRIAELEAMVSNQNPLSKPLVRDGGKP